MPPRPSSAVIARLPALSLSGSPCRAPVSNSEFSVSATLCPVCLLLPQRESEPLASLSVKSNRKENTLVMAPLLHIFDFCYSMDAQPASPVLSPPWNPTRVSRGCSQKALGLLRSRLPLQPAGGGHAAHTPRGLGTGALRERGVL